MEAQNVKEKAQEVLMKQLEILENGDSAEKNAAIKAMDAILEMLKTLPYLV